MRCLGRYNNDLTDNIHYKLCIFDNKEVVWLYGSRIRKQVLLYVCLIYCLCSVYYEQVFGSVLFYQNVAVLKGLDVGKFVSKLSPYVKLRTVD